MDRELLDCALMILGDQCPPDRSMYLCDHGEDPEADCTRCWMRYVWYVAGGRMRDPYAADRRMSVE